MQLSNDMFQAINGIGNEPRLSSREVLPSFLGSPVQIKNVEGRNWLQLSRPNKKLNFTELLSTSVESALGDHSPQPVCLGVLYVLASVTPVGTNMNKYH